MDVKERIVKEAGKLFLENGIKNVSMDYLASSIGISKRTIYENFRDKEEILNTFLLQAKEDHEKKLSQIIDESDNIAEIFIRIIEFHRNKPLICVKFFEDIYKYYPDIYEQIRKENEKSINQAKKFFSERYPRGIYPKRLKCGCHRFSDGRKHKHIHQGILS